MTNLQNKMKNVLFLLLCLHFLLAKDFSNLKRGENSDLELIQNTLNAPENINNQYETELKQGDQVNEDQIQIVSSLKEIGDLKENLLKKEETSSKVKSIEIQEQTKKNQEIENTSNQLEKTPKNYDIKKVYAKMISDLQIGVVILIKFWEKFQPNDSYPFETGTNLHTFYVNVFPLMKLLMLVILFLMTYHLTKSLFSFTFKKSEIESDNLKSGKNATITNPNTKNQSETEKDKHNSISLSLKGRTKRIPKSINYNELFNNNNEKKKQFEKNSQNIKNEIIENQYSQSVCDNNRLDESSCSLDQFFDKVNQQQKLQNFITSQEDLLVFENPDKEDQNNTKPRENQNELTKSIYLNSSQMQLNHEALPIIKEELEDEIDEHSRLFTRLKNNNYIQKTAITNFMIRKPSL